MKSLIIAIEEIRVVGIKTRTINSQEMNPETAKIPLLWQRYFHEEIEKKIQYQENQNTIIAVYTDYASDYTGNYTLIIGEPVKKFGKMPEELVSIIIPAGNYLKFTAQGSMPHAIIEVWKHLWSHAAQYKRAYTIDFEIHYKDNRDLVDLYISIK